MVNLNLHIIDSPTLIFGATSSVDSLLHIIWLVRVCLPMLIPKTLKTLVHMENIMTQRDYQTTSKSLRNAVIHCKCRNDQLAAICRLTFQR